MIKNPFSCFCNGAISTVLSFSQQSQTHIGECCAKHSALPFNEPDGCIDSDVFLVDAPMAKLCPDLNLKNIILQDPKEAPAAKEDDDDLDLFGDETEKDKKAADVA
ncbi:pumilio 23-like protein [Corchorus olitorius]|uniref:Pumilio 23-like protein n=1 Tax=Corchorus olitorius TaxID=93759 RepID=A0A1R3HKS4_9ROSI|nr:pumilio 23-like protein [Corchorus olitorius]